MGVFSVILAGDYMNNHASDKNIVREEVQLDMFGCQTETTNTQIKTRVKPRSVKQFAASFKQLRNESDGCIRHKVDTTMPTWSLLMDPDYDRETGEMSYKWSSEVVLTFFCSMLEWSLMRVNLILKKGEPLARTKGPYRELSSELKGELDWYETEQFELVARCSGYDPAEIRAFVREELSERLHGDDESTLSLLESGRGILHKCESSRSWFEFLDHNYNRKHRGIVCSWTAEDIVKLYSKMLDSTLNKIDRLVCENKATILNRKNIRIVNPELQDEMDWVQTKLFSAVAERNGYNSKLLVKQITGIVLFQLESEIIH